MRQTQKTVSPMSNEGRNTYVITHITDALLNLLKEQSIEDISISELCELAGVGRASFYRNFKCKEDVIEKYLQALWHDWEDEYEDQADMNYFIESTLNYFYKNKEINLLLYKRGMSHFIYEMIRWGTKIDDSENNTEKYVKSTLSGYIFGIVDEWMRQGMPETPKELLSMFKIGEHI